MTRPGTCRSTTPRASGAIAARRHAEVDCESHRKSHRTRAAVARGLRRSHSPAPPARCDVEGAPAGRHYARSAALAMGWRRVQSRRFLRGGVRSCARGRFAWLGDRNCRGASVAARAVSAGDAAGGVGREFQYHALLVVRADRQGAKVSGGYRSERTLVLFDRMRPLPVGEPRRHRGRESKSKARNIPDIRSFMLPRRDYQIDDNWHVAGLRGTGSKDIVVDDVFVPEHRSQSHWDYAMGRDLLVGSPILRRYITFRSRSSSTTRERLRSSAPRADSSISGSTSAALARAASVALSPRILTARACSRKAPMLSRAVFSRCATTSMS